MKLYGEIFSGTILILTITALVRKIKEDPEKVFVKSLKKYANTTQNPEVTFASLKKTWESGEQLRGWCRMDEEYIIACINGPCYKRKGSRLYFAAVYGKTSLYCRGTQSGSGKTLPKKGYDGTQRICAPPHDLAKYKMRLSV